MHPKVLVAMVPMFCDGSYLEVGSWRYAVTPCATHVFNSVKDCVPVLVDGHQSFDIPLIGIYMPIAQHKDSHFRRHDNTTF